MAKLMVSLSAQPEADEFRRLIPFLLHTRTYAHIGHLNAKGEGSASKHGALQSFYLNIEDLTDKLAEAGLGSILKDAPEEEKGFPLQAVAFANGDEQAYFKSVAAMLRTKRGLFDGFPELQALIDEIIALFDKTVYKLGLK